MHYGLWACIHDLTMEWKKETATDMYEAGFHESPKHFEMSLVGLEHGMKKSVQLKNRLFDF